ncbi:MAG: YecR family lipoprotein [Desulfovibrionaceae bacterium]|nr:YecR family lipoprotein [Desulfovibrionaceae bacterium]
MRKIFAIVTLLIVIAFTVGCAKKVHKDWIASTGSKADATVSMAIFWDPRTEIPVGNKEQALAEAKKKCIAWGYQHAEPFGTMTSQCAETNIVLGSPVCVRMVATVVYQCQGTDQRK